MFLNNKEIAKRDKDIFKFNEIKIQFKLAKG